MPPEADMAVRRTLDAIKQHYLTEAPALTEPEVLVVVGQWPRRQRRQRRLSMLVVLAAIVAAIAFATRGEVVIDPPHAAAASVSQLRGATARVSRPHATAARAPR